MVKGYCDNCGKFTPEHSIWTSGKLVGWLKSDPIFITRWSSETHKGKIQAGGLISTPCWCSKKCAIEWFRSEIEGL